MEVQSLRERRDSVDSTVHNSGFATAAEEEVSETVSVSEARHSEDESVVTQTLPEEAPAGGSSTRHLRQVPKRALEEELTCRQQAKLRKKERARANRAQGRDGQKEQPSAASSSATMPGTRTPPATPFPKRGGIRGFFVINK